jgi:hypothetical protein
MYGKSSGAIRAQKEQTRGTVTLSLAGAALLIAILGLFTPNSNVLAGLLPADCASNVLVSSGVNVYGTNGVDGIGAYQVWLSEGNAGSQDDFLKSLIGTKGTNGYSGKDGKSAYQLWLDAGNTGNTDDFIASLTGGQGAKGVDGLSAYELWLTIGNNGTLQQFLNSLVGASGANGANGTNGSNGLSAYEIWRENGNAGKTVADFLNSLKGADGAVGPSGPAGPSGAPGANGQNGVCNIGVGGYYASFWDQDTQTSTASTNGMLLGYTGSASGISAVKDDGTPSTPTNKGSWIKFDHAGTYNIAFSAQLSKTGGSAATISIWLQKLNGSVSNLDYTNTNIGLANNSTEAFAAWNFFVDVNAGDRVRLAWHTTDVAAVIEAKGPVSNGVDIPGIPSVIVTVNQVR